MKLNIIKLGIFLATFALLLGIYSQPLVQQASAELRIPDSVGIIAICNNQDCSAEVFNTKSNDISQEQVNIAEIGQNFDFSQTVENSTGPSTIGLSDFDNTVTQSNAAAASIEDSGSQTNSASTTCTHND